MADRDEAIVVEGYTDVLALVQVGVTNVVASMGTALTDAQVGLMMRFTGNVTLMFDADRAGTEAMLRSADLARARSSRPMVALLPGDQDPADVAIRGGAEAVAQVLAGKISLLGFELRQALARSDISTSEGRVRAFEEVRRIMARASSIKEREEEIAAVADRLRLSADSVALLLKQDAPGRVPAPSAGRLAEGASPSREAASADGNRPLLARRLLEGEAAVERDFLIAAACHPKRAVELLEALTPEHFTDPSNREVLEGLSEALQLMTNGEKTSAFSQLRTRAHGDSEAGRLFVRLLMEADQGRYAPAVLEELHLRLQEQHLSRSVNRLRRELQEGRGTEQRERHLFHLEQLLYTVRASLTNLDPEEG